MGQHQLQVSAFHSDLANCLHPASKPLWTPAQVRNHQGGDEPCIDTVTIIKMVMLSSFLLIFLNIPLIFCLHYFPFLPAGTN